MSESIDETAATVETVDRRRALAKLAVLAGAVYSAPVLLQLAEARASGGRGSGGRGSGGRGSGGRGSGGRGSGGRGRGSGGSRSVGRRGSGGSGHRRLRRNRGSGGSRSDTFGRRIGRMLGLG
jgi:hypothetical protein